MYLYFRRYERNASNEDSAFAELYSLIHSSPAPQKKPKTDFRIQVNLVESKRINGKPRMRHIATIGNLPDDSLEVIGTRLESLDLDSELKQKLLKRIKDVEANNPKHSS